MPFWNKVTIFEIRFEGKASKIGIIHFFHDFSLEYDRVSQIFKAIGNNLIGLWKKNSTGNLSSETKYKGQNT